MTPTEMLSLCVAELWAGPPEGRFHLQSPRSRDQAAPRGGRRPRCPTPGALFVPVFPVLINRTSSNLIRGAQGCEGAERR